MNNSYMPNIHKNNADEAIKKTLEDKETARVKAIKKNRKIMLEVNKKQHYLTRSGFLRVRVLHDTKGWQHTRVTDYSEIAARPDFDYLKAVKHLEKTLGHKIYTAEEILKN